MMGFIHEEHGNVSIETRRESFVVHAGYPWWGADCPDPEFSNEDAADLIAAIRAAFPDPSERAVNP